MNELSAPRSDLAPEEKSYFNNTMKMKKKNI